MNVAFVENSEDHIHDEDHGEEQQRQRLEQLTKDKRFSLEYGLHTRELATHLCEAVFDEFGRVTNRDVREQVEVDGHAGELIEVIDRLWTNDLLCRCYGAERHEIGRRASSRGRSEEH